MSTPSTKCPKCGSEFDIHRGKFQCGSWPQPFTGNLVQSEKCELTTLRTLLEKAKEALKPFDEKLRAWEMEWGGPVEFAAVKDRSETLVELGHLRRASAVLKEIESV